MAAIEFRHGRAAGGTWPTTGSSWAVRAPRGVSVDILRSRISEGYFPPGTRLSEDSIGGALGVSRNTLREAFRLLTTSAC